MRTGPRPLSVHIGMAASHWAQDQAAGSSSVMKGDNIAHELSKMLLGIQKYHLHSYQPQRPDLEVLWQKGEARLLKMPQPYNQGEKKSIILIPSLVNKAYIMNLNEQRSLMQFLYAQGVYPYLLDWGSLLRDDGQQTLDDLILNRFIPAVKEINKTSGMAVHGLGYCMGGTMLAAVANIEPDLFRSLIFLASPWDFHAGSQRLLNRVKFWAPTALPQIDMLGHLSVDWIQTLFALLDPSLSIRKFVKFYDLDNESQEAKLFVTVEDWLNDGVDLPENIARECVQNWFLNNDAARGMWSINGKVIKPENIRVPVLTICSTKDNLVEYETAMALHNKLADKQKCKAINPKCGHIGMIAGKSAVEKIWLPIVKWIE